MGKSDGGSSVPGKWRQHVAAIVASMATVTVGLSTGWPSPTIPQLISDNTPVTADPLTDEEVSWLLATEYIGSLVALPFSNVLSERFGRKITGYLVAIPAIVQWLLKFFAKDLAYLVAAQALVGVSRALAFVIVPLYIAEIAGNSIRGRLGSFVMIGMKFGTALGYGLGAILSYHDFALYAIAAPLIFLMGYVFMPETPVYLIRKHRVDEATRSLKWLRNNDKATVDSELSRLQRYIEEKANTKKIGVKDLFRDRETTKGVIISIGILSGQQINGIPVVLAYTSSIFALTNSTLSPNAATVVVGSVQFLGTCCSSMMMEYAGRRSLILISCAGMAICHSVLATYLVLSDGGYDVSSFNVIPVVSLSSYAVIYSIGIGPAAFVVSSEVLRSDIADLAHSISVFFMCLVCLLILKFFPSLAQLVSVHGCFFIFAFLCTCIFVFTYFLVPETKGKSIEAILKELGSSGKKSNKSQSDANNGV